MNEQQPRPAVTQNVIENPELTEINQIELPYPLIMDKNEIMALFRGDNPGSLETKRLVTLWMEEAQRSVEGIEEASPVRESMLKAAQENLFTVTNLARWDKTVDPEAIMRFNAWLEKAELWVSEKKGPECLRRQIILEIERADVYLSVGDEEEAYNCLEQAIKFSGGNYIDEESDKIATANGLDDLSLLAKSKINAITKVLNFLNLINIR